jgi:hypothetical protein
MRRLPLAIGPRELAAAFATLVLFHLADRILAGFVQYASAGSCPW